MDLTEGSIFKKLLLFTIPLIASSLLQLLFNTADVVVVGKFAGDNSLAAVASNLSVVSLFTNLFVGLSVGSNVIIARYYGANQQKELSETVHTSMTVSVIAGVFLTVIGVIFADDLLRIMQTPEAVLPLATLYLRIYFLGMTFMMVFNFGSAILRAIGDTKRPFIFLLAAGIINVILNLIFVAVFNMDVAGVAIATIISQGVSAALIVRCLLKEKGAAKLEINRLSIKKDKVLEIMRIGLPAGFQGMLFSISNLIIQSSVNSFGETFMSGSAAAQNLEQYVFFVMNGFHQATICFTSQNLGAGKMQRVYKTVLIAEIIVLISGFVLGGAEYIFGEHLLLMYTDSPEVIKAGVSRLSVIAASYCLCGMMDVMVGALRGIGYSFIPMLVSVVGVCGLRAAWIFTIFQMEQYHTTDMLFLSYPISWVITFVILLICFIFASRKVKLNL